MQNNRKEGTEHENQVAEWLRRRGYRILEQNFRCRLSEIDLIAERNGCIVFVEVKYKRTDTCGTPEEAAGSNPVASTPWKGCRKPSKQAGSRHFLISTPR